MMRERTHIGFGGLGLALCLLCSVLSAEPVSFTVESPGGPRPLTLELVLRDGVGFVSLQSVVEQAGGTYNSLPTRLRVDLDGSTAWLRLDDSRVNALSIFSLKHPIAVADGAALIAVDDVPDFFLKSFRLTVRPVATAPETAPPPPTPSMSLTPPGGTPVTPPPAEAPVEAPALEELGDAPPPVAGVSTIIIDPAHGGYDTGLLSTEKLSEAAVTLAVATRVKALLDAAEGPSVVLTRADDADMADEQRAKMVRATPGGLLVSLHLGSSFSPSAQGIAALYPAPPQGAGPVLPGVAEPRADARLAAESRRLAETLAPAITVETGAPLRGVLGVPLKQLNEYQVPSVELELGCLSSAEDARKLATDEYLSQLAAGIVKGLTAFLAPQTASPPLSAAPASAPGDV